MQIKIGAKYRINFGWYKGEIVEIIYIPKIKAFCLQGKLADGKIINVPKSCLAEIVKLQKK